MKKILALAATVALTGCVTVTPQMERVRVTSNPEVVHGCKFLGNITFSGGMRLSPTDSEHLFRKKVVEIGGDTGYVVSTSGGRTAISPVAYSGEAYLCGTVKP